MREPVPVPDYQAPALDKGLAILEYLSAATEPHSMAEIAKAVGRSRNEIYRMLVVLERRGYLERASDDRYRLTHRLFDLAMQTPRRRNLHDAALPCMHQLAETIFQSCHLVVASGREIVVVARVESPDQLGFAVRVGYRRPMIESTSGRILHAFLPADQQARVLARISDGATPADIESFLADVAHVAASGYLAQPSAFVDAVADLAAPVIDGDGIAVASLVVPFVSGRSARTTRRIAIQALVDAAAAIGSRLKEV